MTATRAVIRRVTVGNGGDRLDQFLAREESGLTRSQIRRLIDSGCVFVNNAIVKPSYKLHRGDRLLLTVPPPQPSEIIPEEIPLHVVYQDQDLLVVDKPSGLAVHPGPGHPGHTLVNGILAICPDLKGISGTVRPGIVHRLDKDTSGLIVVAKNQSSHVDLCKQFKERQTQKIYLALVQGTVKPSKGVIEAPIGRHPINRKRMAVIVGGRSAITRYKVLWCRSEMSFLEVIIETGRTHQIRVHLAYLGHPIFGDALYGKKNPILNRHFLHAHVLRFFHPTQRKFMEFVSPIPEELQQALSIIDSFGRKDSHDPSN